MKNYYEELEVSRNASNEIINRAYKVLAKKYHPDSTTENKIVAEEKFKKISEAYEVLSNPQKRAYYDKTLMPEIDSEKYKKVLQDNKIMAEQLSNLKSKMNNANYTKSQSNNTSSNQYNRPQSNNINNYQQSRNTYYNPPQNQYYRNNTQYYNNVRPQTNKSSSFFDVIKYHINLLLEKILRLFFAIAIIAVAIAIIFTIPSTRNFLTSLHLDSLLFLFK